MQIACLLFAACLVASLSLNSLDYFNRTERFLFADVFTEFPILMPRRYLYTMHAITMSIFLLPVGLGTLLVAWLARQK